MMKLFRLGYGTATAAFLAVCLLLTSSQAHARQYDDDEPESPSSIDKPGVFGIGLGANPLLIFNLRHALRYIVGVTGKVYLPRAPLSLQLTGNLGGSSFSLMGDLLYESPTMYERSQYTQNFHVGGGGSFGLSSTCVPTMGCYSSKYVGAQLVVGSGMQFKAAPVEVVFEWRPTVYWVPAETGTTWGGLSLLSAMVAVRYFFGDPS